MLDQTVMLVDRQSTGRNFQAQNFSRLALGVDPERSAADLTVGDEPLARHTGVHGQVEDLPAERALDGFRNLHRRKIARHHSLRH